jgi:glycine/D-amino acid oxidase-like deaminating enzyme
MQHLPISAWTTAPPDDLRPVLDGDRTTSVCVIGAGFTGLSAALALRRSGTDVVLLERDFAGFGASGRNAGHLTPTIGKDVPTLLLVYGERRTAELLEFAEHAVGCVETLIGEHAIDCDYWPTGNVMAAVAPAQEKRLRKAAETARRVGAQVEYLDRHEMRRRGLPTAFIAGAWEKRGGTLDPGKLVRGLRRVVLDAGVPLHESTPVLEIVEGTKPRVRTVRGSVTADTVILATNAYTVELGHLRSTLVPLHDTLFESAPLGDADLARIGWPGREGIYTAHESLESYRLTARGTIVGGSKAVRYPYGGRPTGDSTPATIAANVQAFRDRFPEIDGIPVAHTWGGWIDMTIHFLPVLGTTGEQGNVHYAAGFNGHGVAQACAMGPVLADRVLGRPNALAARFAPFAVPLPPEPLRWLLVRAMLGAVVALDRRVDARVRRNLGAA